MVELLRTKLWWICWFRTKNRWVNLGWRWRSESNSVWISDYFSGHLKFKKQYLWYLAFVWSFGHETLKNSNCCSNYIFIRYHQIKTMLSLDENSRFWQFCSYTGSNYGWSKSISFILLCLKFSISYSFIDTSL